MRTITPAGAGRTAGVSESHSLAGISHPNLVPLYELISDGQQWFFTMQLIDEAVDFMTHVRGEGAMSPTGDDGDGAALLTELLESRGGNDFTRSYTEQIAQFTRKPSSLQILSWGALTSSDPSHPYHRRDGNVVDSINPATGGERITAFGGVVTPGKLAAYTNPIHVDPSGPTTDTTNHQRFSQYQCPVSGGRWPRWRAEPESALR